MYLLFLYSQDERALIWYSKEREKRLSLNSVSSVVLGQKTVCGFPFPNACCYSLVVDIMVGRH
jgi:hypothetical protein